MPPPSPGLRPPAGFTRRFFRRFATALGVRLGEVLVAQAKPKEFSTGSLGWHATTKLQVRVGDKLVWVQVNVQATVCGSKAVPEGRPDE
jgi:hypothetical protein